MTLRFELAPIAISAFIGAFAWWFTHVVDRSRDAPLIAYKTHYRNTIDPASGPMRIAVVRIQNLSSIHSFNDVVLILRGPSNTARTSFIAQENMADLRAVPPAPAGHFEVAVSEDAAQYSIALVPPLAEFELTARFRGAVEPVLVSGHKMSKPYLLVAESFSTFVIRHENLLIGGALAVWLFVMIGFWCAKPHTTVQSEDRKRWRGGNGRI